MKGAEAVLACLRAEGVKYIFGNPGTTEIPLLDALSGVSDITYLMALQESVAVGMADGYARSGGKLGFVNVHTGAGTANSIGGIYNAFIDKTPLVVTAGCKDTRLIGRECFSEVSDFPGMTRQFTKQSRALLRADRIAEYLLRAIKTAIAPPSGPVFLSLAEDLLHQEVEAREVISQVSRTPLTCTGDEEAIREAARLLITATKPLLVVGSEVARSGAVAEAVALADQLGLPVMTDGRDSLTTLNFPHTHPAFRDSFESSSPTVAEADVVLGIGCKMFTQTVYSPEPDIPPSARIIHFHSDAHELGRLYPEAVSVLTDAKKGIASLLKALEPLLTEGVKKAIRLRKVALAGEKKELDAAREKEIEASMDKTGRVQLPILIRTLGQVLEADAILVDEAVRSSRALLRYYDFATPGTYYRSSAGVLGWGVPAALGVKLANPDRQVVAFVGDGSFTFSLQSLWTAAKYAIPVVIVICNNRLYKAVKDASLRYKGKSAQTDVFVGTDIRDPEIDFCRVAAGFGVWAKKVVTQADMKPALQEALQQGKPAVLEMMLP